VRLLDGEDWRVVSAGADANAFISARTRGFVPPAYSADLTPLGREVAELLRPNPWRVEPWGKDWAVFKGGLVPHPTLVAAGHFSGSMGGRGACDRIAALLTQDDLRAAKTYRTEPDQ
jgi:hypothetical protein